MGVLPCYRPGCESVMCDRYSSQYGYICDTCFTQLLHLGAQTNIGAFMERECNQGNEEADFAYFDAIFQRRDD